MLLKGPLLLVGSVSECYSKVLLLVGSVKSLHLLVGSFTPESAFTLGVCYTRVCFYWCGLLLKSLLLTGRAILDRLIVILMLTHLLSLRHEHTGMVCYPG